jgi:DNA repair exonuclease SbcCD ATPase subunit
MGKVIKLYNEQEEERGITRTTKKQKRKEIKFTRNKNKAIKEFKKDINICLTRIEKLIKNLAELEELEHILENLLDEEHYDERIPPAIKGINILLEELTNFWFHGVAMIRNNL